MRCGRDLQDDRVDQPPGAGLSKTMNWPLRGRTVKPGSRAAQPLDAVAEEAGGVHDEPGLEARRPRWRAARPNPSAPAAWSSAPVTSRAPCRTAWVM